MNNISVIEDILNFSYEEKIRIVGYTNIDGKRLVFDILGTSSNVRCPGCGRKTSKRHDHKEYKQSITLKHIVFSDNRIVELRPIRRYFRCTRCGDRFFERFSFESTKGYHTLAFESYVLASWGYISGSEIGRLCGISGSKVYHLTQNIDVRALNERGRKIMEDLDEIHLGIDEHAFRGKDMILVITELKKKEVLAILHGITNDILESWVYSLPIEVQQKIAAFSTDMHKGYRNVIEGIVSHPIHVVDKYHLFQEANRMMTDVVDMNVWALKMGFVSADDLIRLGKVPKKLTEEKVRELKKTSLAPMRKYKEKVDMRLNPESLPIQCLKDQNGEPFAYKEITLEYFLEKKYLSLFRTREKNLSSFQKLRLNQVLSEFDFKNFMKEAWLIKERFFEALDERDITSIDTIIQECLHSGHYRIEQFGRTLSNWYRGIEGFCRLSTPSYTLSNAFTECVNGQCKYLKRQSR